MTRNGKVETKAERESRLDAEALAASARADAEEAARNAAEGPPTFLERIFANHKAICDHVNGTESRSFLAASILTAAEALCERLDVVAGSVNELTFTLGEIRRVFRD